MRPKNLTQLQRKPCKSDSSECSTKRMRSLRSDENRKKKKLKSWANFGDDLCRLADKVFPGLQVEARQELALSRYLDQLYPSQILFAVKKRRPRIYMKL